MRWQPPSGRNVAISVLSPLKFARETAHFRNTLRGYPTDRQGAPVPWYSYPAVDFISQLDFSDARVCEYGGGQSTLWWAQRAKSVFSIDDSQEWYGFIAERLNDYANAELVLELDPRRYPQRPIGQFDVVIIDGGPREACAEVTLSRLISDDSLVIVDNSEAYPVIDQFTTAGWARIDFHGFAAAQWRQHCTSLIFKAPRWFQGLPQAPRKYEIQPGSFNNLRGPWRWWR